MKMKKFFAFAMAALTLVACGGKNEPTPEPTPDPTPTGEVTITPARHEFKVGETVELTVSADDATWQVISNSNSVTLSATTGKKVVATAAKAGNATVIATVGTEQAYATLVVKEESGAAGKVIEASEIYPIILDAVTFEANKDKVISDFRVNDETNFLYIWTSGETYNAGDGSSSKNFFGNMEGYTALTVASAGWSGGGFFVGAGQAAEVSALAQKIMANPDDYFFHMGLKSTDATTHWFYLFGLTPACDVVVGPTDFNDNGTIHATQYDFTRNGAWGEIVVPCSKFASALSGVDASAGLNILSFLSGGTTGAQLNMDACYIYKK